MIFLALIKSTYQNICHGRRREGRKTCGCDEENHIYCAWDCPSSSSQRCSHRPPSQLFAASGCRYTPTGIAVRNSSNLFDPIVLQLSYFDSIPDPAVTNPDTNPVSTLQPSLKDVVRALRTNIQKEGACVPLLGTCHRYSFTDALILARLASVELLLKQPANRDNSTLLQELANLRRRTTAIGTHFNGEGHPCCITW